MMLGYLYEDDDDDDDDGDALTMTMMMTQMAVRMLHRKLIYSVTRISPTGKLIGI